MLKFVYSFFLGLLLVIFVGMGIATFYEAPKAPEYPKALEVRPEPAKEYTTEERNLDQEYQYASERHTEAIESYNRNVSIIALVAAVILLVLGLTLHTRIDVVADGLLLGGTFTLLYSIGRSFAGDNPKYSFMVTSIGLLVTMVVGYVKFVKPSAAPPKAKKP